MHTYNKNNSDKSSHSASRSFFSKSGTTESDTGAFFNPSPSPDTAILQTKSTRHQTQKRIDNQVGKEATPEEDFIEEGRIQTKLTIGQPNDPFEQEADAVAEMVVNTPAADIQRQGMLNEEENKDEEEAVQAKCMSSTSTAISPDDNRISNNTAGGVQGLKGVGHPLPHSTQEFFESRLGQVFTGVRIHSGPSAEFATRQLNARAFTHGQHIAFARGQYAPQTREGQHLLAHELTHVVQQQRADMPISQIQRSPDGFFEQLVEAPAEELNVAEELLAGALIGDFREDHTFWTTIGQIVVGFIPYAGQVADVRDLLAGLNRIINHGGWRSGWEWLNLILILIGFIPGLGDIIKGVGRAGLRWLRRRRVIGGIIEFLSRHVIEPAMQRVIRPAITRIKREIRRLVDSIGERIRRIIEDRRSAVRRALEARRYRRQLERALEEAEERAARRGRNVLDDVTDPNLRRWTEADPHHRELAYDPAHRGFTNGSVREAQAGLAAESQGILRRPIRRDLSGGAEFIDGAGRHWDVKRPDTNSIVNELTRTDHYVLVDARDISRSRQRQLLSEVRQRLVDEGREELAERVSVVRPPGLSRQAIRTGRIVTRRATESREEPEAVPELP